MYMLYINVYSSRNVEYLPLNIGQTSKIGRNMVQWKSIANR